MAIAFNSTQNASAAGTTTVTYSHTCSGADRVLIVSCCSDDVSDDITGVTYNGVSLTLIDKQQAAGGFQYAYLFRLVAPAVGANNVVVTRTSTTGSVYATSMSYTGVDQTSPVDAVAKSTAASSTISMPLTTTVANAWLVAGARNERGWTAGANTTIRTTSFGGGGNSGLDSGVAKGSAGAYTLEVTQSDGTRSTWVIASLKPAIYTDLLLNLVSYYKLDEASGTRYDSHASNTLTDNNTVGSATGIINLGGDFIAGNSEYLSRAAQTWGIANTWSVSLWAKTSNIASNPRIFHLNPSSGTANEIMFLFANTSTGYFYVEIVNSADTDLKIYKFLCADDTVLANYVVTWDGTNLVLYENGSLKTPTKDADGSVTMTDTSRVFALGSNFNGSAFLSGIVDEVGIWSRVLTSGEVTSLYNAGAGLAYPLVQGTAYTLTADTGSFALVGVASLFNLAWQMIAATGAFVLSGIDATFQTGKGILAETGVFILTGLDVIFSDTVPAGWTNPPKHNASATNPAKNTSIWTNTPES